VGSSKTSKQDPKRQISPHPLQAASASVTLLGEKISLAGLAVIILLTFFAYSPAIRGGFIWDDDLYPQNPIMTQSDGLRKIWTFKQTYQYYPLTYTAFWVQRRAWDLQPMGYHIVNVFLHIFNAVLVWVLFRKLRIPGAWVAAAVFALHPVHVESVAWISELKNVLSGFFYLSALLSYLKFEDEAERRWYWGALSLFLLALLSKTATSTLPATLLIIRWFKGLKIDRGFLIGLLPFILLTAVSAVATIWLETNYAGASGPEFNLSFLQRIVLAGHALWFYAAKLVWPRRLAFNYELWLPNASDPLQWLWVSGVVAAGILVWRLRGRLGRGPAAGLAFFTISLVPALGFFKIYPQRYSFVADHFQYLSSLGMIAIAAGGAASFFSRNSGTEAVQSWLSRRRLGSILIASVLLILGTLTWRQARGYRNITTLWRTILVHNPNSFLAHNNLGMELAAQGELKEAIDHYKLALKARPDFPEAHNNLGLALFKQGKTDEAIAHYNAALNLRPDMVDVYNNLGLARAKQGNDKEALQLYKQALRQRSDYALAYYNMANLFAAQGNIDDATQNYKLALEAWPDYSDAHNNLANVLANRGDISGAVFHYQMAIRAKPALPDAHINLANILIRQGKTDEAIRHYKLAIQAKPDSAETLNNLANALAGQGNLDEAIQDYRLALKIRPDFKEAHNNLGLALERQGKTEEAIRQYKLGSQTH